MYKIGICDDELVYIEAVRQEVEDYFGLQAVIIQIYHTANEILVDENKPDLLFLDIEMPALDGITLKNRLDGWGESVEIVFVTNYQQYMNEAFGRNVIAYVAKDEIQTGKIQKILQSFEQRKKEIRMVKFAKHMFLLSDIYYIHAGRGYIEIYTQSGRYGASLYLKDALKRINSSQFQQTHRSYVVHLKYIRRIESDKVILANQTVLPLSRKYRDTFRTAYFRYVRG